MNEVTSASQDAILIIDDDAALLQSLARVFRTEGFGEPILCADPRDALSRHSRSNVGLVLLDLSMPYVRGDELLGSLIAAKPSVPVVVVTATNDLETAVRCVKAGAFDYLVKPVDVPRLITVAIQAFRQQDLRAENRRLKALIATPVLRDPDCFKAILGQTPVMQALFRQIEAIAPSQEPVLIVGETGTGKELVAQSLHHSSERGGDLVTVNVAGIDDTAFADTLFGHVKGAFTSADRERVGMVERAGAGTLFLDEIGDMDGATQVKLLRLLQEREYLPLGADRVRHSRCRLIAATHQDLRLRMRERCFREDLFYRLHGHMLRVPPLRERIEDVPLLADRFFGEAAEMLKKPVPTVPRELYVHLSGYLFPGNVRELRAMVFDAVARHDKGVLSLTSFHEKMDQGLKSHRDCIALPSFDMKAGFACEAKLPTVEEATRTLVASALARTGGNQGAAARMLGLSRRTINRYLMRVPVSQTHET